MVDFRTRIRHRETFIGPLITIGSPQVAEAFVLAGFDWFWIDMEHTPLSLEQVQNVVQAIATRAGTIVRVPWNDPVQIKRVLDIGCDGILVPQVKTAEEARRAVAAAKYPPLGLRSVGIARAQHYGMTLQDYVVAANDRVTVMLQIEHIEAVAHVAEILAVANVDAIVIGPYDLSASMGMPGQIGHPEVAAAIATIADACNERKMPWGAFAPDVESANAQLARGATIIALATDTMYLWKGARTALAELRPPV